MVFIYLSVWLGILKRMGMTEQLLNSRQFEDAFNSVLLDPFQIKEQTTDLSSEIVRS